MITRIGVYVLTLDIEYQQIRVSKDGEFIRNFNTLDAAVNWAKIMGKK